jgi:4-oxalocrotonate tautomerase
MPRVHIEWLAIRNQQQREEVARRITEAIVEVVDIPVDHVTVVFHEQDPDMVIKGGIPWSRRLADNKGTE